jgi:hypothetical protein
MYRSLAGAILVPLTRVTHGPRPIRGEVALFFVFSVFSGFLLFFLWFFRFTRSDIFELFKNQPFQIEPCKG